MVQINVKGDIIPNDYAWIYQWMEWDYTCPRDVNRALEEAAGDDVLVLINSPGGYCVHAEEIYSALKFYGGKVEVHVVGIAASAASMIACAGDRVLISPVGMFMIHNASRGSVSGDYRTMEESAQALKEYNAAIKNAYMEKTAMTEQELQDLMDKTTYMSANAAVEHGFADALMESSKDAELVDTGQEKEDALPDNAMLLDAVAAVGTHVTSGQSMERLAMAIRTMEGKKESVVNEPMDLGEPETSANLLNTKNQEGGTECMTLAEMMQEHPELAAEFDARVQSAKEEGQKAGEESERARMQAIDSIAAACPADMIASAKYTDIKDASALALELAQRNAAAGQAYMQNAIEDSEASKANDVDSAPTASASGEPETDESDVLAGAANQKRNYARA